MRDKLLFGTIGLLVGVVVMQWEMPSGQATIATSPVGVVVAAAGDAVLCVDGSIWIYFNHDHWEQQDAQLPFPVSNVQFFTWVADVRYLVVDKNGDQWEHIGGQGWFNRGQPPVGPVGTTPATFGKVKAQYNARSGKP